MSGCTLFSAPSEPEAHTEPSKLEPENVSSPQETISTENVKPEVNVGDYVCIHSRTIEGFHIPCRIVGGVCWPVAAVQLERCSEHLVFLY